MADPAPGPATPSRLFRGRHTGPRFGVPPSGDQIEFRVTGLVRFRNGWRSEHWAVADAVTLLRRTDALP
ncbi:ester cyclase [Streptomyces sp. SL13]|uniref:Ester cyclase n=1 Tax=Streptantibioticus silvisoli TaxID=2705255 RepID=A0AA90H2K7_9ACTN|nr:ester cyclase [Streptantibioticus silvisoli]MDI5969818.1 ester cyclase [Streptantibioticus silvisoli]